MISIRQERRPFRPSPKARGLCSGAVGEPSKNLALRWTRRSTPDLAGRALARNNTHSPTPPWASKTRVLATTAEICAESAPFFGNRLRPYKFLLIKNRCKKKITAERMAQSGQKEKTLGVVLSTPMTWPEPQRSCARRCREKCRKAERPTRADLGPSALHLLISNGARSRKTSAGRFPISNYDKARTKFGSPVSRKRWEDPSWLY